MFLVLTILSQIHCFINKSFLIDFVLLLLAVVDVMLYYSPSLILQPYGAWRFLLTTLIS